MAGYPESLCPLNTGKGNWFPVVSTDWTYF